MNDLRYPAEAAGAWVEISSELLRSVVHTLNNRVASVEGMGATLETGEDLARLGSRLASEGERLRELTEVIRLLSTEGSAAAEAGTLGDLIEPAARLARLHPDLRDANVDCRGAEAMPAIRVRQRRAVHALALAILAAASGAPGDVVVLCSATQDDAVQLMMRPLKPASGENDSAHLRADAANALLQPDGGRAELQARAGSRAILVSIPGLAASRRARRSGG